MNAQKARTGILTMLVVGFGVLGLAGCGGDNPTATPVAPTATTMTSTADPTATTSTETTMDPTATTSTETTMDPTATTSTESNTGGNEATDLLSKAGKAMQGLKTYHMTITSESGGVSSNIEADVELPDKFRMLTTSSGVSAEIILIGDKSYTKVTGTDQYIEGPGDASMLAAANTDDLTNVAQGATIVGDETINGVNTTHINYTANMDATAEMVGSSEVDIWIDESTGYIHQIETTSEAGGVSTSATITYSKHNEPISPAIEKPTNIMTMP